MHPLINKFHKTESFLRSWQLLRHSKAYVPFVEPEGLLPSVQKHAIALILNQMNLVQALARCSLKICFQNFVCTSEPPFNMYFGDKILYLKSGKILIMSCVIIKQKISSMVTEVLYPLQFQT